LPSFINYATPLNDKVTVAFSSHQFLGYKNSFSYMPRRTISLSNPVFPSTSTSVDMTGFTFSGAVGLAVTPKLRIGGALSLSRLAVSIDAVRGSAALQADPSIGTNINAFAGSDATLRASLISCPTCAQIPSTAIHDTSMAAGATVGLLYQATDALSLGAVYAYEPRFKATETVTGSVRYPTLSDTSWEVPLRTPPRLGGGIGYRAGERVLAVVDVVYVQYSTLAQFTNQQLVLFRDFNASFARASAPPIAGGVDASQFTIRNGTDAHGGVEVNVLRGPNPVFLRYGLSRTANHTLSFGDPEACSTAPDGSKVDNHSPAFAGTCNLISQLYFVTQQTALNTTSGENVRLGTAEIGYSFGGGIVVGRRTQIDAAFLQTSYKRREFVLSSAIRF